MHVNWTVSASGVGDARFHESSQALLHGDLLVSYQGTNLVFTCISDGGILFRVPAPGAPRFSATPVAVREKVYVCMPGFIWEVSSVTRSSRQIPLGNFYPSEHAYPVPVAGVDSDYLVVPGIIKDGTAEILFFDVKSGSFEICRLERFHPEDEIRKPVCVGGHKVILTTKRGTVFQAEHISPGLAGWVAVRSLSIRKPAYLSAPSYEPVSRTVFVEYYDRSSSPFRRGVLKIHPASKPTVSWMNRQYESATTVEVDLLIFEPVISAGYAIVRSQVASTCHFFSAAAHQVATVNGLFMDPVAVAGGCGKVVTIFGSDIQVFAANPAEQAAQSIPVPGLNGATAINRPILSDMGIVLIQTSSQLIGWGVC